MNSLPEEQPARLAILGILEKRFPFASHLEELATIWQGNTTIIAIQAFARNIFRTSTN